MDQKHRVIVLSSEPEIMVLPFGVHATLFDPTCVPF